MKNQPDLELWEEPLGEEFGEVRLVVTVVLECWCRWRGGEGLVEVVEE